MSELLAGEGLKAGPIKEFTGWIAGEGCGIKLPVPPPLILYMAYRWDRDEDLNLQGFSIGIVSSSKELVDKFIENHKHQKYGNYQLAEFTDGEEFPF